MTSYELSQPRTGAEQRDRAAKASFSPTEPQPDAAMREQAARSVMHPDYHDPDWRYYHGAMAIAS